MEPYILVVFVHNTVKSYEIVSYNDIVNRFINLCHANINVRADLDCRSHFVPYSDDKSMVQLIGFINPNLTQDVINAINKLEYHRKRNW